jgi:hypothetical protein
LVVVDAKYGVLDAIVKAEAEEREHPRTGDTSDAAADSATAAASASHAEPESAGIAHIDNCCGRPPAGVLGGPL